uniref:G_PROTEIN_RECEP_F1_2 domain-containing protein n=1 Tax=Ascaris lumbricoides TaxID=6252 RepID=A0A0M3IR63_ASCLU
MVLVCFTYVLSNAFNVFITSWEFIDFESLLHDHFSLYMTCTDLASMLAVLACMLRLPIYMANNREIRGIVMGCFVSEESRKKESSLSSRNRIINRQSKDLILKQIQSRQFQSQSSTL